MGITATQGTSSDSRAVSGWGKAVATPITLSLGATRLTGTAPAGIQFTATATSPAARVESPFHDIEYVWSFDDPGNYRYLDNAPLWGAGRNVAYGPVVSHIFSVPGTYMVTCTAHDGENPPKSETIEITVEVPNAVFPGTGTAVVSMAGNFAMAPSGATQHTSIAAAIAALAGKTNQRLLLRRGETYTSTVTISETTGTGKRILVGDFGTASDANPKIDRSAGGTIGISFEVTEGVASELMVKNIDYEGGYDPTDFNDFGDGGNAISYNQDFNNKPETAIKIVWGGHFKNCSTTISANASGDAADIENVFMGDCWIDGWYDYGMIIGNAGRGGWCGMRVQQRSGTRNGDVKYGASDGYDWPNHGPIRISRPTGPWTFHNCDIVSMCDWSSAGDATSATKYSINPCIRWNTGSDPEQVDQVLVVDRVRTEGAPVEGVNETTQTKRTNAYTVVDRFYMVASNHASANNGHGGTTWRNGIFLVPNTIPGNSTGLQYAPIEDVKRNAGKDWVTGLSDATGRRVEIYSCALIDLRNDVNAQTRSSALAGNVTNFSRDFPDPPFRTDVEDSFIGNILGYAPNRGPDLTGFSAHNPLDITPGAWTPLYIGEKWKATRLDMRMGYDASAVSTYRPLTGSAAIGGASGKVSLLDFDGNLRSEILAGLTRSVPSIGPYEPALES